MDRGVSYRDQNCFMYKDSMYVYACCKDGSYWNEIAFGPSLKRPFKFLALPCWSYFSALVVAPWLKHGPKKTLTSIMLAPAGPTVLTIWTLGVEVERCLWRDWPSPPGKGKRKAEVGDRRAILCISKIVTICIWILVSLTTLYCLFNLNMLCLILVLTQRALGLRLGWSAMGNFLALVSVGTHLYKY